jgi:predicted DNA-binding protein YlxM (UPF0122 family)
VTDKYSPAKRYVLHSKGKKYYGVPGDEPAKTKVFDVNEDILVPLADAYERFILNAYPPQSFGSLKFDEALRKFHFKMARRFFEFHRSPAFAHAFSNAVEKPVTRLRKFEHALRSRKPRSTELDDWSEDDIQEYAEIIGDIEEAADYLRQLAWMIGSSQKSYAPNRPRKSYPKGYANLGNKTNDLSFYLQEYGHKLTERQRDCFSLRAEYARSFEEIAGRLGIKRQTAEEHYEAASKKMNDSRSNMRNRSKKPTG